MAPLSLPEFVEHWKAATQVTEMQGYQQHFMGICDLVGQPYPTEPESYTFQRGVTKTSGGQGWADVWMRGHFGWEYKGKGKDLGAAYQQLSQYREDLENPPLLVVCDFYRFEIHTNFTDTAKRVYAFTLDDLLEPPAEPQHGIAPLSVLKLLFENPSALSPGVPNTRVTEEAAAQFSRLAESLRSRGVESERAARFLMRLVFCLFAEDIGLLPSKLFSRLVDASRNRPADFKKRLRQLFGAMAKGGSFGVDDIAYFDGGLFTDDEAFDLTSGDLAVLAKVAKLDWSSMEAAIFGTLFERSLDPDKRSQLGAHYTSKQDILLVVEPVLMEPLRRRWTEVKEKAAPIIERTKSKVAAERTKARKALGKLLKDFSAELASVRVLDPACGSGNFLYLALKRLLDLEKEVSVFAANNGLSGLLPRTDPSQLYGIETNVYAHELASVTVWIGYLQWQNDNGFNFGATPILKPLDNIKRMDAVLVCDADGCPVEPPRKPEWPEADVIIGNPPFLGGKRLRTELGDSYVEALFTAYAGRVPPEADLVTYWFEKARAMIQAHRAKRAGLLATQGIRGGANRVVLERIKESGGIFMAHSDRDWILDGANVHVSIIGFDDGSQTERTLDGKPASVIHANLTSATDTTSASALKENAGLCFMGITRIGAFDLSPEIAGTMLAAPRNPNGRPNSDVVKPWVNALDITRRPRGMYIIDFGVTTTETDAALYEEPFEYIRQHVYAERQKNNREGYRTKWWIHGEPRPAMRKALAPLHRYIATPLVSKFRIFAWLPGGVVAENLLNVFAREDDYFFGVLHSRLHEVWGLHMGTALEDRPRYTPSSTFETFPFPWPPGHEPKNSQLVEAIAAAARDLVAKRNAWLNPPGASEEELKTRTLTNLYNARPAWLADAHRKLDEAVFAAYGWPADITDDDILARLLARNQQRAAGTAAAAGASAG